MLTVLKFQFSMFNKGSGRSPSVKLRLTTPLTVPWFKIFHPQKLENVFFILNSLYIGP